MEQDNFMNEIPTMVFPEMNFDLVQVEDDSKETSEEQIDCIETYN